MARHTFSLFSLGERAVRVENELLLTRALASTVTEEAEAEEDVTGRPRQRPARTRPAPAQRAPTVLRIPDAEAPEELLSPPAAPQANSGADSELLIGKVFAAAGWEVVYYNQRRGYGFDLWVRKDGQAFVVEVKSFAGRGASVTLTALEFEAANHHGGNFLLVVVEDAATYRPIIRVIQNPAASLVFTESQAFQFSAGRAGWLAAAEDLEP
ncbi:protein NO VEIN domain-containing protein [Nitratireductor luteus]|uniref:protein NO VEIN domain-containing protein n=1 Tax=Nitratireductor luteus TaxID=2976980 RepID=UPI00223F02F4